MKLSHTAVMLAVLALSGCSMVANDVADTPPAIPEEVVAIAAPYQNIMTARLMPEDNCYWYEHAGPVETTLIPLLSTRGRPICVVQS